LELCTSTTQKLALKYNDRHKSPPKAARTVDQSSNLIALGYFYILVGNLARLYTSKPPHLTQYIEKISSTITYIEKHFDQPIDIGTIIKKFGFSRRNFYRSFLNLTGLTPNNYLLRIRISHALHLLQTSSKSITEIAFECGFEDSNYFSRQFKKIMKISPRMHREHLLTNLKNTSMLVPHVYAQPGSALEVNCTKSRTI
jgi:AraC-like DNA-binding protein